MRLASITIALLTLLLAGCETRPADGTKAGTQAQASNAAPAAATAQPAAEAKSDCGGDCGAAHKTAEHDCTAGAGTEPVRNPEAVKATDPASGAPMLVAGDKLAGVPVVKIADLLARPEEFAGKTVRLEGNVTAMCHHKRGWFSIQDPADRSGAYVRVIATPAFLVPEGAIGKRSRAEGVVEVSEVAPEMAKHLQGEHELGDPAAAPQTKAVIVRATGAEFI